MHVGAVSLLLTGILLLPISRSCAEPGESPDRLRQPRFAVFQRVRVARDEFLPKPQPGCGAQPDGAAHCADGAGDPSNRLFPEYRFDDARGHARRAGARGGFQHCSSQSRGRGSEGLISKTAGSIHLQAILSR